MLKISQDRTTLAASGHVLGHISWASTPESFRGPTTARRLYDIYHSSAKQNGFTIHTFCQVVGDYYSKGNGHFLPAFEELLLCSNPSDDKTLVEYTEIMQSAFTDARYRTFFATDSGHFGRSYHPSLDGIAEGDLLVALFDVDSPFLLRPLEGDRYSMINVAYVVDYKWGYTKDYTRYNAWLNREILEPRVFEIV